MVKRLYIEVEDLFPVSRSVNSWTLVNLIQAIGVDFFKKEQIKFAWSFEGQFEKKHFLMCTVTMRDEMEENCFSTKTRWMKKWSSISETAFTQILAGKILKCWNLTVLRSDRTATVETVFFKELSPLTNGIAT